MDHFLRKKILYNFTVANFWKQIVQWMKLLKINFPKQIAEFSNN